MDKKKDPGAPSTITTTTTLAVHRCRFVDYAPSAITALAFPPLRLPSIKARNNRKKTPGGDQGGKKQKFGVLAVGHANGNIDICEWMGAPGDVVSSQSWVPQKTFQGPYPSKVDSLAFVIRYPEDLEEGQVPSTSDLRLFSSGGGSDLIEWDLERSCIRRTISSQGGSIWSIAVNPSCSTIALGCEDGSIRLISVVDDTLSHLRRFDRLKCHILSLAWGPPVPKKPKTKTKTVTDSDSDDEDEDEDEDEWQDSFLISGGSDSSLRKWDVKYGRVVERMGVDKVRGERTLVWAVGVLGDGTIISGDSLGVVKFWDPRTCTQLHSFKAHGADVLCMAISPEGKAVYTSGVDQKTVQFSLVKTTNSSSSTTSSSSPLAHTKQWTQTASRRMHSHDVRSLAIWPPYTPLPPSFLSSSSFSSSSTTRTPIPHPLDTIPPILASGGLDMSVVLTPSALPTSTVNKLVNPLNTSVESTFEEAYHRKLGYVPQGAVKVSRGARMVSCVRESGVTVWRVKKREGERKDGEDEEVGWEGVKAPSVLTKRGKSKKTKANGNGKDVPVEALLKEVDPEPTGGWEMVLEMELAVRSNVVDHEISDDGRWMVVSDLYETKLFALEQEDDGDDEDSDTNQLSVKRIKDFSSILQSSIPASSPSAPAYTGGRAFKFSPDSSKLVIALALTPYILVVDLTGEKPRVLRRFDHHRMQDVGRVIIQGKTKAAGKGGRNGGGDGDEDVEMGDSQNENENDGEEEDQEKSKSGSDSDLSDEEGSSSFASPFAKGSTVHVDINRLAISADGQWLATSDSRSRTHIFNLDSISHHTTLPTFHRPAQALTFDPSHPSVLLLAFPDNTIQIYDVESKQFPGWGKDLAASLPRKFTGAHEPILGVAFEPPASASSTTTTIKSGVVNGNGKERRKSGEKGREREKKEENKGSKYLLFWSSTWLFKMSLDSTMRSLHGGALGAGKKRRRAQNGAGGFPPTPSKPAHVLQSSSSLLLETPDVNTNNNGLLMTPGPGALGVGNENEDYSRQWWDYKMVTQYRPIACCDFLDRDELVVVERPLTDVLATLPAPYFKHKYGAS